MGNLVVLAFDNEAGAGQTVKEVEKLQKEQLIIVEDAAVVVRNKDGKAKIKQATSLAGVGALGGAFWGMLFGLLFFAPFLGMAIGAASGALFGKATDYGINDDFIKRVSAAIKPGNSALFLMVSEARVDKVVEKLKVYGGEIIHTSLSLEEEKALKEAFEK